MQIITNNLMGVRSCMGFEASNLIILEAIRIRPWAPTNDIQQDVIWTRLIRYTLS